MKLARIVCLPLVLLLWLALPLVTSGQEPAIYNMASYQPDTKMRISPGGQGNGPVYFYNIDGNRTTHIALEASQAPEGWEVKFQPSLIEAQVEEGGSTITVTQNLQVEPSIALLQQAAEVPDGMICVNVGKRGYVVANVAEVMVHVPKSAEVGTNEKIVVSATARWLGQTGAVVMTQGRDFEFSVEVVPSGSTGSSVWKWILGFMGAAAVIVAAVFLVVRSRRKRA